MPLHDLTPHQHLHRSLPIRPNRELPLRGLDPISGDAARLTASDDPAARALGQALPIQQQPTKRTEPMALPGPPPKIAKKTLAYEASGVPANFGAEIPRGPGVGFIDRTAIEKLFDLGSLEKRAPTGVPYSTNSAVAKTLEGDGAGVPYSGQDAARKGLEDAGIRVIDVKLPASYAVGLRSRARTRRASSASG